MGRRRFGSSERVALFMAADGRCSACGVDLVAGWHADHILAHSRGGRTDVLNGQALCSACNLHKGAKMPDGLGAWPLNTHPIREWQRGAFNKFLVHRQEFDDFLLEATPGAGKTRLGLYVARYMLDTGHAERVVVVCPTGHLREQWAKNAAEVGLQLNARWSNEDCRETSDFHGIVVTYQSVASAPLIHRRETRRPTLAIFDEIHHAADEMSWGAALREAYEQAAFRLHLSGTPFRTDRNRIPWIPYIEETGGRLVSKPDHRYSYGDALSDGVCRAVFFPSYEGEMRWSLGSEERAHTFSDDLNQQDASRRLLTALDPHGDWIQTVLRDADAKLSAVRDDGDPDAGGLVIAKDQSHAKMIATALARIAREPVSLAVSDEPGSSDVITAFTRSDSRWIVAVRMVSEGVDIPRLRVCVFASNVTSELFFRQAVGRVIRVRDERIGDPCYFFIPCWEPFIRAAQEIKMERDHQISEEVAELREQEQAAETAEKRESLLFVPEDSRAQPDDVFHPGGSIGQDVLAFARRLKRIHGLTVADEHIALILSEAQREGMTQRVEAEAPSPQPAAVSQEPRADLRVKRLRTLCNKLVVRLATAMGCEPKDLHGQWKAWSGKGQADATEKELRSKLEWCETRLKEMFREV